MKVPAEKQWDSRLESEGESAKAYSGFCVYRDMGRNRSLDASWLLATKGEKRPQKSSKRAPNYWKKWSATFHWISRAAAYDDYKEKTLREEREKEEAALRQREREEVSRIRRERIKQMKQEQWEDSCRLRDLSVSAAEFYRQNPSEMSAAEMVKVRDQCDALRVKALDLVEMAHSNAIAALVQDGFLPDEAIDAVADVWENASELTREGISEAIVKRYRLRKFEEQSDEEEFLEQPEQEEVF